MRALIDDARYAVRRLRKAPAFTALAALTLALGIGVNAAVFSVVDPLLWRPLPVRDPDRLVHLGAAGTLQTTDMVERPALGLFAARSDVFEGVLADAGLFEFRATYRGRPLAVSGEIVSSNFLSVLGVDAVRLDAAHVVLGHAFWTRTLNADPGVIGETLTMNGRAYTIAGVAPAGFFGITVGASPDLYASFESGLSDPAWIRIVGRLRPGLSSAQAGTALASTFQEAARVSGLPEIEKEQVFARLTIAPAGRGLSDLRESFGTSAWILIAVVALVLLVASANVANLMLTRASERQHEVAVQIALGATPGRLARQFVLEGSIVAILGTAAGVASANWTSRALVAALSIGRDPLILATVIDARMLTFSAAVLALTAIFCGVVPALTAPRRDPAQGLKVRGAGLERGARPSKLRQGLVVAQIAASVTLLSGTGLLLRSLTNLYAFNLGFDPDRVLAVTLADGKTNRPVGQADAAVARVIDETRRLPGVELAALAGLPLLTEDVVGINVVVEGGRGRSETPTHTFMNAVTPSYFETLGLPLVMGRECTSSDTPASPPAVILNRQLARGLFGDASPLNHQLRFIEGRRPPMTIIGVAADAVYNSVREEPRNFLYLCGQQSVAQAGVRGVLFVRGVDRHADRLAPTVQRLIQSIDLDIRIASIKTLGEYRSDSLYRDRLTTALLSGFTLIALAIAAVGLYGVLSAIVARQTREIGLRMALGADTRRILQFVFGPAARMLAVGFVLGGIGAFVSSSLVSSLLFGLGAGDPLTYVGVVITLALAAALACYVPSRRAIRVDPMTALRTD